MRADGLLLGSALGLARPWTNIHRIAIISRQIHPTGQSNRPISYRWFASKLGLDPSLLAFIQIPMSIASGAPRSTQTPNMLSRDQLVHLFARFSFLTSQPGTFPPISFCPLLCFNFLQF